MSKADLLVERGASFLEELAHKAAAEGGFAAKLAEPLAEDAGFLRKLKPSLVAARLKGEHASADGQTAVTKPVVVETPAPPKEPRKKDKQPNGGPNPLVVAAGAFVAGVVLAKLIDWRGHAHPRL